MKRNLFTGICLILFSNIAIAQNANIFTSELALREIGTNNYEVAFTLNADATNVEMNIYREGTLIKTVPFGAMEKGRQTQTISTAELPNAELTWELTAYGAVGEATPTKFSNDSDPLTRFANTRGIAVDRSTESPYFGRIYVASSAPGTASGRTTGNGIYILDAALTDITQQADNAYAGNVDWASSSSPMRTFVAEDGRVFMADWSDGHSGIWIMDPANPQADFTAVFGGVHNSSGLSSIDGVAIHGSISNCYVEGTGENTVLYTIDEDYTGAPLVNAMGILKYDIGTTDLPWVAAPSGTVFDNKDKLIQNACNVLLKDKTGGWWISQYRYDETAAIPSLIHVNAEGDVDYNAGEKKFYAHPWRGGLALSYDQTKLAIGCEKEIYVFNLSYDENNIPSLEKLYTISTGWSNSYALAFDIADNIYLAADANGIGAWALPKAENKCTVPAPSTLTLQGGISTGIEDTYDAGIAIGPNPVNNELLISGHQIDNVEVYDISGKAIYRATGLATEQWTIDTSSWNKGVYIVKVNNQVKQIIK